MHFTTTRMVTFEHRLHTPRSENSAGCRRGKWLKRFLLCVGKYSCSNRGTEWIDAIEQSTEEIAHEKGRQETGLFVQPVKVHGLPPEA